MTLLRSVAVMCSGFPAASEGFFSFAERTGGGGAGVEDLGALRLRVATDWLPMSDSSSSFDHKSRATPKRMAPFLMASEINFFARSSVPLSATPTPMRLMPAT